MTKGKKIGIGIVVFLLTASAVLMVAAPKSMHSEHYVVIGQPANVVFAKVRLFENNKEWNPWISVEPKKQTEIKGTDGQVGSILTWYNEDKSTYGEQELKSIADNERLDYEIRYIKPIKAVGNSYYALKVIDGTRTQVSWGITNPLPVPLNALCVLVRCASLQDNLAKESVTILKNHLDTPEKKGR